MSRPVVIGRRGANALRATRHHVAADVEATLAAHEPTAEDEPRVLLDGDDVVGAWLGAVRAALRA